MSEPCISLGPGNSTEFSVDSQIKSASVKASRFAATMANGGPNRRNRVRPGWQGWHGKHYPTPRAHPHNEIPAVRLTEAPMERIPDSMEREADSSC